jgi:hypothetical protein
MHGGKHTNFVVTITAAAATGVRDDTISHYSVEAEAVKPAGGCVIERDNRFADGPAGTTVRATLDLARGEGGETGWCPGNYRGRIVFFEGFACPSTGTCEPPADFPTKRAVVARFAFTVR